METNKIKEIAREIVNTLFSDPDACIELCTPDCIARHSWGAEYKGIKKIIQLMRLIKSNPRITIDDCFAENDRAAVRFRAEERLLGMRLPFCDLKMEKWRNGGAHMIV